MYKCISEIEGMDFPTYLSESIEGVLMVFLNTHSEFDLPHPNEIYWKG